MVGHLPLAIKRLLPLIAIPTGEHNLLLKLLADKKVDTPVEFPFQSVEILSTAASDSVVPVLTT